MASREKYATFRDDYDDDEGGGLPWEERARERLERAWDSVEIDEAEDVVRIDLSDDGDKYASIEEFDSLDELQQRLTEVGDVELSAYAPFENGESVFDLDASDLVADLLAGSEVESFLEAIATRRREAPDEEEVFHAGDLLAPSERSAVFHDLSIVNREAIAFLARHPEKMYELHPRKFEELVAELLRDLGYERVELTPQTHDGGRDIHAFYKTPAGTILTFVECKRNRPDRPVGVEVVRALRGTMEVERATFAAVATTSYFSPEAQEFVRKVEHQMSLKDHNILAGWLRNYRRR